MKISSLILMASLLATFFTTSIAFSKDKPTLAEKMAELGDDPVYVKEKGCTEGNCNEIPYPYETMWFWLKKSEKKRRLARNIAARNKWLIESGEYPTESEVKSRAVKRKQAELEKRLRDSREKSEKAAAILKEKEDKLQALQEKRASLVKSRDQLLAKTRDIFNSSDAATRGHETLTGGAQSLLKGQKPLFSTEEEDKVLDELEKSQKDLRTVIKDMRDLGSEINEINTEAGGNKAMYDKLADEIEASQSELEETVEEYGELIAKVNPEKEQRAAQVKLQTQEIKIKAAKEFARDKVKELRKKGNMAEFISRDFADIKKDLKLSELEAKALSSEIDDSIESSVLGRYIREQNEKTLSAALEGACTMAKLCSEHDSINDSRSIKKDIAPVYEKLKEQLGSGRDK